ncbi:hypothetical protein Cni_G28091 [Canna indica]|uniref:Uncharacterized protein n=1 Tax=Canna indica TaxID=4628 RepID=A0AAQ3L200_9LILI|nr:hypothetical protein Cni_G28091 [Canna indica]
MKEMKNYVGGEVRMEKKGGVYGARGTLAMQEYWSECFYNNKDQGGVVERVFGLSPSVPQLHRLYWIAQKHPPTEKPHRKIISKPSSAAKISQEKKERPGSRNVPRPLPLCSLCRHKAPVFEKPPRRFTYRELEIATDGFSDTTFVAEGGGGCVHQGALEDGRVMAVKRLKAGGGCVHRGAFCSICRL